MSDFLKFLNTADLNTLTQVSGITRSIAGNMIAARPFDTVDDCLKVHGMGKGLLSRLQAFAEAQITESENRAMIPVEQEAPPAVVEESQRAEEKVDSGSSFWARMGKAFLVFLRALVRLVMIVFLFVVIGSAFYYGLPYINRTFIAPVEKNTAQISKLEDDIATLQKQLDETNSRITTLETSVETHTAAIEKLTEMQATLETQLKENNDKTLLELKHQIMATRALDILGRARMYLAQSNFGLAQADVQAARDLLADLNNETHDKLTQQVVARLDLALGNLPDFPVVASGDVEIAWQILVSGQEASLPPTPTPEAATATPLPPATLSSTPTP
ncbi:MAG: helix-hairpin-helix domain-containing protein [Anaerolineales bacterium]